MRWLRQENVQERRKCGGPVTHYQRSFAKGKELFEISLNYLYLKFCSISKVN